MGDARSRILDAASALLARAPRSSLTDVAAAAGVGRTTVHRHFPTRDSLIDALALAAVQRIGVAIEQARIDDGDARGALARLVEALLPLADEFHFASSAEAWADLPELRDGWERLDAEVSRLIDRGKAAGEFRTDVPTPLLVDALAGLIWAVGCSVADGRTAPRSAPHDLLALFTDGIGA